MKPGFYFLLILLAHAGHAFPKSDSLPVRGKPIPGFELSRVYNYSDGKVNAKDFRGKWLFLDFWSTGCSVCIKSMPKIDSFSREFKNDAVFVMIGRTGSDVDFSNVKIEDLYERIRVKQRHQFPYAFDSTIFRQWHINGVPHMIIVDPEGVVRFITSGQDLTREKISGLVAGNKVSIYEKLEDRPAFAPAALENGPDAEQVIHQSSLEKWKNEGQSLWTVSNYMHHYKTLKPTPHMELIMFPLYIMYMVAYTGEYYWNIGDPYPGVFPMPVIRLSDPSLFEHSYGKNLGKGLYNYRLVLPPSKISRENIMEAMQQDLKRAFGYEVAIEETDAPVWKLVVVSESLAKKMRSKGGKMDLFPDNTAAGFKAKNYPADQLLGLVTANLGKSDQRPIFVNETGITGNIDLAMDIDMADWEKVKMELRKNGLDLVEGFVKMRAVVISDPKPIK